MLPLRRVRGSGSGGARAGRNDVMCLWFPLLAVVLLSVGVAATPEEDKAVQEQPPAEVKHLCAI